MDTGVAFASRTQVLDFGLMTQNTLELKSKEFFGIMAPLDKSAPPTVGDYRAPERPAEEQVALAPGLTAEYLTRKAADNADMFAFWPNDSHPTHLIICIEGPRERIGKFANGRIKLNPSVQRVKISNGEVETLLRGMKYCDGIRATPWGTILATEETADGAAYEIQNPLTFVNHTVVERPTGKIRDMNGRPSQTVARRNALPIIAWEGLMVLESGVVIGVDDLLPGTGPDVDGGAIFKFVPTNPRADDVRRRLASSPLVSGTVYSLQVSCRHNRQQFGQGCEVGNAAWLPVIAARARIVAHAKGATGFHRAEDLHRDIRYGGKGVRFCWANTGNERAWHFAEVICGVDRAPLVAKAAERTVVVNRFVEGDQDFNSFDNLAFQADSGILYVVEDQPNGDIFACLPDGRDRDLKSDGCIRVISIKDSSAEPAGFEFTADGSTAYLSIQHSKDGKMMLNDDYPTDDIVRITGFKKVNQLSR